MSTQREKAEELRRLHEAPEPLVLVNVWDAASARVVAAAPGCRAIATASWSIAAAHGYPDGEAIPRETMIEGVRVVAPRSTCRSRRTWSAGSVTRASRSRARWRRARWAATSRTPTARAGCGPRRSTPRWWRRRGPRATPPAIPLVINARTDVWLTDVVPPEERVVAALERGAAYLEAGADCIFVPGVRRPGRCSSGWWPRWAAWSA